jgi:hypothetical protein
VSRLRGASRLRLIKRGIRKQAIEDKVSFSQFISLLGFGVLRQTYDNRPSHSTTLSNSLLLLARLRLTHFRRLARRWETDCYIGDLQDGEGSEDIE